MNVELRRRFRFEAAHRLPLVPPEHPCFQLHGHSYGVEIAVAGPVDHTSGWLMDFDLLDQGVSVLIGELDHRLLNDVEGLENPTCELICVWLWSRLEGSLDGLVEVTVSETPQNSCTLRA